MDKEYNLSFKELEIGKVYEGKDDKNISYTSDYYIKKEDGKFYYIHTHKLVGSGSKFYNDSEERFQKLKFKEINTFVTKETLQLLSILKYNWIVPGSNLNFYNQKHPRKDNNLNTKDDWFKIKTSRFCNNISLIPLFKYCIDYPEINISKVLSDNGFK